MGQHKTSIHWERNTEHFNIKSFNRDHVIRFENGVVIHATSAPEYTGNPDLISPEDLFVATISSCHMMTFLAVASLINGRFKPIETRPRDSSKKNLREGS